LLIVVVVAVILTTTMMMIFVGDVVQRFGGEAIGRIETILRNSVSIILMALQHEETKVMIVVCNTIECFALYNTNVCCCR
jgi:glutamate racemase